MDDQGPRQEWSPPTLTELGSVQQAETGLSGGSDGLDIGSGILP